MSYNPVESQSIVGQLTFNPNDGVIPKDDQSTRGSGGINVSLRIAYMG